MTPFFTSMSFALEIQLSGLILQIDIPLSIRLKQYKYKSTHCGIVLNYQKIKDWLYNVHYTMQHYIIEHYISV